MLLGTPRQSTNDYKSKIPQGSFRYRCNFTQLKREEVNPDKLDNCDRTPLLDAARGGREGVV